MNDTEREQWVNNDEGLYSWWRSSRLSMRAFIRENRAELTNCIQRALNLPPKDSGSDPVSYDLSRSKGLEAYRKSGYDYQMARLHEQDKKKSNHGG